MKLTNQKIFEYNKTLQQAFTDPNQYVPARVNFLIQRNALKIAEIANLIDEGRIKIAKHYGTLNKEGTAYDILPENMESASKELEELFAVEQDINIKLIKIDELKDINLTMGQMQAILFMMDEEGI